MEQKNTLFEHLNVGGVSQAWIMSLVQNWFPYCIYELTLKKKLVWEFKIVNNP